LGKQKKSGWQLASGGWQFVTGGKLRLAVGFWLLAVRAGKNAAGCSC